MTATDLLEDLIAQNVVLTVDRTRLLIDAPKGVVTPELRQAIAKHKPTIIEMLTGPPESEVRQRWVICDCNRRMRAALAAETTKNKGKPC